MKCLSVDNQPRLARCGLIDLNPGELHSYLFVASLDKFGGSCKILDDLSDRLCISNKTEDAYLRVINMITGNNESRSLLKHISSDCRGRLDYEKFNSKQK